MTGITGPKVQRILRVRILSAEHPSLTDLWKEDAFQHTWFYGTVLPDSEARL